MNYLYENRINGFSLADTLACGQCFTFFPDGDGFTVWSKDKAVSVCQRGDLLLFSCSEQEYREYWEKYFALDMDYAALKELFSRDPTLQKAVSYASGIRVLRQDLWDATCSFIISQNNNIKRITGIVRRLCESLGEPVGYGAFSFPRPEVILRNGEDGLAPLRCGFRAAYILDAARVFSDGIDEHTVFNASLEDATAELEQIRGVGKKVASCALLYGANRWEAFPRDVWINRVMEQLYPDGLPEYIGGYKGIAQQYLFHYARTYLKL